MGLGFKIQDLTKTCPFLKKHEEKSHILIFNVVEAKEMTNTKDTTKKNLTYKSTCILNHMLCTNIPFITNVGNTSTLKIVVPSFTY